MNPYSARRAAGRDSAGQTIECAALRFARIPRRRYAYAFLGALVGSLAIATSAVAEPSAGARSTAHPDQTAPLSSSASTPSSASPSQDSGKTGAPSAGTGAADEAGKTGAPSAGTGAADEADFTSRPMTGGTQPGGTQGNPTVPRTYGSARSPGCAAATENGDHSWIREGFYMRIRSGAGFVGLTGTGPAGDARVSAFGSSSNFVLGASVARGLVLAGTFGAVVGTADFHGGPMVNSTVSSPNGATVAASTKANATMSKLGLLVDWYPAPASGWHASASFGVGGMLIQNLATDTSFAGGGVTGGLSVGHDWAIARQWSMGIELGAEAMSSVSLKRDDDDTGYKLRGLWVGLQGSILYY